MRHARPSITAFLLVILAMGLLASQPALAHDTGAGLWPGSPVPLPGGGSVSRSGWFHIIYGDAFSASGTSGYVLIDDQDQASELVVDADTLAALGGPRALNHRRVTVTGQAAFSLPSSATAPVPPIFVQAIQLEAPQGAPAAAAPAQAVSGPAAWVSVLCRFADSAAVTPHPKSWFETLILGTAPPGLDHYWREVSYNTVNLGGSAVYGWYTLPQPRSYYVYGNPEQLDFQRAVNDCTAAADADVSFPSFVGINLMFNQDLDCCAWGGSWTLTRDGQTKTYRVTWLPPWGYDNQGVVAHEMGHGFGLPHSSGPYTQTYDSAWDVMSGLWENCPPYDATYGCVGPHTISYHKDILGWIPAAQKYVASAGTSQTIQLERLGQPTTATSYLMAQLRIGGSATQFYTVEVRRFAGYDGTLPGQAVVIHKVDTTRSDRDAQVVDSDNDGDPNDAGAMWLVGETFLDSANGLSVTVNAENTTGYQVTVTNGVSTYTLSVSVSGSGTVTSTPAGIACSSGTCGASFASGTSVSLAPSNGTLTGWGGACTGTGACAVTMTANKSVSATFATTSYTLSVSVTGLGTVTSTPAGIACSAGTCTASFASGTSVSLAPSGGTLTGWGGACAGTGACAVSMTANQSVSAAFATTAPYGATYQASAFAIAPNATITVPVTVTNTGSLTWGANSAFRLSYHWYNAAGSTLVTWDGLRTMLPSAVAPGGSLTLQASVKAPSSAGTYTLKWDMLREAVTWFSSQGVATKNLTINVATTYTLSVSVTGPGTVTSTPAGIACSSGTCTASFASGTSVSLAPSGGALTGWGGACTGTGACAVAMTANKSVSAAFAGTSYTLSVSVTGSGTVTSTPAGIACSAGTCSASFASGTSVSLAPSSGTLTGWGGACTGTGACAVSMTANQSVSAAFTTAAAYGATYQASAFSIARGATITVPVTVSNTGSLTWGANSAFRLSYHWYKGSTLVTWDGLRTMLPSAVAPGMSLTLQASVKAPSSAGTYTLKWDMLREAVTWFSSQGVATKNLTIVVP